MNLARHEDHGRGYCLVHRVRHLDSQLETQRIHSKSKHSEESKGERDIDFQIIFTKQLSDEETQENSTAKEQFGHLFNLAELLHQETRDDGSDESSSKQE